MVCPLFKSSAGATNSGTIRIEIDSSWNATGNTAFEPEQGPYMSEIWDALNDRAQAHTFSLATNLQL